MSSPVNPPDSPPAQPTIPEGMATKFGKYGALAALVLAVLAEVTGLSLDEDTKDVLTGALALLLTTMLGRYAQAAALYRDAPSPNQAASLDGGVSSEEEALLAEQYPGEPPEDPIR